MNFAVVVLVSIQTLIGLIELAITLNKHYKQRAEEILHIPEEDREP